MSIKQLNSYQFTDESIKDIREYLKHQIIPRTIKTESSKYRFVRKAKHLLVDDGKLMSGGLEVVPEEDINKKLDALYQDPAILGGIGRDKAYQKIKDRYIGITKDDVMSFLDNQESYQVNKPYIKSKIVQPIVPTRPNQRWQMDLIILKALKSQNSGHKYILTVTVPARF